MYKRLKRVDAKMLRGQHVSQFSATIAGSITNDGNRHVLANIKWFKPVVAKVPAYLSPLSTQVRSRSSRELQKLRCR